MVRNSFLPALPCILAAVLAAGFSEDRAQTFVRYRCEDGSRLSAMFIEGSKAAYLQLDGKSLTLPQKISASGARFGKRRVTFWIKGASAQLKRPQRAWTSCVVF